MEDDIVMEEEIWEMFIRLPSLSCDTCCCCGCIVEPEEDVSVVEYQGLVRMRLRWRGDGAGGI